MTNRTQSRSREGEFGWVAVVTIVDRGDSQEILLIRDRDNATANGWQIPRKRKLPHESERETARRILEYSTGCHIREDGFDPLGTVQFGVKRVEVFMAIVSGFEVDELAQHIAEKTWCRLFALTPKSFDVDINTEDRRYLARLAMSEEEERAPSV